MTAVSCLVIDDDQDSLFIIEHCLEKLPVQAYTASSVVDGCKLFRLVRPDIIIIEWHNPAISALEFLHQLPSTERRNACIIVSSAEDSSYQREKAMQAGADYFLVKPYPAKTLQHICKQYMHCHSC